MSNTAIDLFNHQPVRQNHSACLLEAGASILELLVQGRALTYRDLRQPMTTAFGGSDAEATWQWKDAYEAQEVAGILFLRRYAQALAQRSPADQLRTIEKLQGFMATQTLRSDTGQAWQQFSTPLPLAWLAVQAAQLRDEDIVLEPSAGTGLLAIMAEPATLILNELEAGRHDLLRALFKDARTSKHNAEYLNDLMNHSIIPSVVLMNPPFSTSPTIAGRHQPVIGRHVGQALARLARGGRMVAITGHNFGPHNPRWRETFITLQESATIVFSIPLAGKLYACHGTSFETRLTVIDKVPATDPHVFLGYHPTPVEDFCALMELIETHVPKRPALEEAVGAGGKLHLVKKPRASQAPVAVQASPAAQDDPQGAPLAYTTKGWVPGQLQDNLYEHYTTQVLSIDGAQAHPTRLVQSSAMAAVAPPVPSYQPMLPPSLLVDGILSDAQLESIIYAGEAHSKMLPGTWTITPDYHLPSESKGYEPDELRTIKLRRGWFLGDGTGCGKGRQVAGMILDNRLQGRKRALWISDSDKLLEDARRDWGALGGHPAQILPLSRFKQSQPIVHDGILFVTYATLRSPARDGKPSRLQQILNWLGEGFDGPLIFDESHAMANAVSSSNAFGTQKASQRGQTGLRLQRALPNARVVYVSATGATHINNLGYAERLGLWGEGTAFANRHDFVRDMDQGGIAAMEVISRDMKAMGLYTARALSYEGVEVDILEHTLTAPQIDIYDSFARAYHTIHQNIEQALKDMNVTGDGTYNRQAKAAAMSAFESSKQRFFNHMLTAMKCPSLIRSIESDIERGDAVIIQLVSTSEAMLNRRLADIPSSEWHDLNVDVTPREYVLDYLYNSFPTQLHELYTDEDGHLKSRAKFDEDGHPVICREAAQRRDDMIEMLAGLPAVPAALDQILHHFGHEQVAEITGRSLRIIREEGVCKIQRRPSTANLAETHAFMDDEKRILVFSQAGGTGRSYHADLGAKNHRRRVHYLLEPGWQADRAIQGLGRSNRTNQAHPPRFRPVATNVKGEKRFLSTISRRLDSLGAITRGQRQTGGQGMFRHEDNLESMPARAALRQLYQRIKAGEVPNCSLTEFQSQTGLELVDKDGTLKEDLPPMSRFLNRMLALTIRRQNAMFEVFEEILDGIIEGLRATGVLDVGIETLTAHSFTILEEQDVFTFKGTRTRCLKIQRKDRLQPTSLEAAMRHRKARPVVNQRSGRAGVCIPAPTRIDEHGASLACVRIIRPVERESMTQLEYHASHWKDASIEACAAAWDAEVAGLPEFRTSEFTLVTGLLLPIWDKMRSTKMQSTESMRIYRLQTEDGQRLLGRMLKDSELHDFKRALGIGAPDTDPAAIWASVLEDGRSYDLVRNIRLRRSSVMSSFRVEIVHNEGNTLTDRLVSLGCVSETIAYQRRVFVPVNEGGQAVLARVLEVLPLA